MERASARCRLTAAPIQGRAPVECPLSGDAARSTISPANRRGCRSPSSTAAPSRLEAPAVTVEVHLANGLPSFTLVGLADTEVKEARERVRAALQTSGLEFPHNKRITVNLAPADLPKESGRFDLPIALGILAAAGQIDAARLEPTSSPASCRSPASCARCAARWRWPWPCRARRRPPRTLVLPPASADEAALVPGLAVRGADHLLDVVRALLPAKRPTRAGCTPPPLPRAAAPGSRPARRQGPGRRQARARDRRGGRQQPADGRPAGYRQVDAGAAPRRPAAAADARRGARVGGDPQRRRRASAPSAGASACCARRTTPPRRRRWSAAARRRDRAKLAGAPRRAVPRRAARVSARRARGAARAARERAHRRLARRAPGRVPGPLPARRGDEPLPVRPARPPAARAAAARRTRCCATRASSAARCSTASTCRSKCRRSPRHSWRRRPTASRAPRSPAASPRRASAPSSARAAPTASSPVTRSTPCRLDAAASLFLRQRRCASAGRHAASTACCGWRAPSPTRGRAAIAAPHLAEAIQYRRVLTGA